MIFVGHPETGATLSFPASIKIPFDPKNGGHQQTLKRLGSSNSNISIFIPMWGSSFDEHIFQMGWLNHQLEL